MQKAIYTTVGIDELLSHVQALKGVGARFVQMHAERNVDDGTYRLVYTFINVRAAQGAYCAGRQLCDREPGG